MFSYFNGLHGSFSVLSSLLQKRSHGLQLLLHFTHTFSSAKKLQDHHITDIQLRLLIKCMNLNHEP